MQYNGSDKWKQKVTELLNRGSAGGINGVCVNGESVVKDSIAYIIIPTLVSELDNDVEYVSLEDAEEMLDDTIKVLQEQIEDKQPIIDGAASTITDENLPAMSVLVTNTGGKIDPKGSGISRHELEALLAIKSNIQDQLDDKASSDHNHVNLYYSIEKIDELLAKKQDYDKKARLWKDNEGGNLYIQGPNDDVEGWQVDNYNSNILRFFTFASGVYKGFYCDMYGNLYTSGYVTDGSGHRLSAKQNTLKVTQGNGTRNTTYTTNGNAVWRKYGKLVIVDMYDITVPAITKADQTTNILFSGLPAAKHYAVTNICPMNTANGGLRVGIAGGSDKIVVWWQTKSGAASGYSGQLMYLTDDE